jgi:filamentous hemagglutinin
MMGARYYDPQVGRFISPDPVGYPINIDLYAYADSDPINNYDPDGRFASSMYQTVKSTAFDLYRTSNQKYGLGHANGYSYQQLGQGPFSTSSSMRYNFGRIDGVRDANHERVSAFFAPLTSILFPERRPDMAIGEVPFFWSIAGCFGSVSSTVKGEQIAINAVRANKVFFASRPATSSTSALLLRNKLIAEEISGGHAFTKHVINQCEFPGFSQSQFEGHLRGILNNPSTEVKPLTQGRTGYWDNTSGTVIVRDPFHKDGGTAFRPGNGIVYFIEHLK